MNLQQPLISKSIDIEAPGEQVWEVLTADKFTRLWYAEFSEGTYVETDWTAGSKAVFTDKEGNGLIGRVIVNRRPEELGIEYLGLLVRGKEDYASEEALALKGSLEAYHLSELDGLTRLSVHLDMSEELFSFMSAAWDRALRKIKELSEITAINFIS